MCKGVTFLWQINRIIIKDIIIVIFCHLNSVFQLKQNDVKLF